MEKKQIVEGSWKRKIVSSDLLEERQKCDFDKKEAVAKLVDEKMIKETFDLLWMQKDPILKNTHKFFDMTRE